MEILESISWIGFGFVPILPVLEIYDRLRGRKKSVLRGERRSSNANHCIREQILFSPVKNTCKELYSTTRKIYPTAVG
jgi:hypothetical protein